MQQITHEKHSKRCLVCQCFCWTVVYTFSFCQSKINAVFFGLVFILLFIYWLSNEGLVNNVPPWTFTSFEMYGWPLQRSDTQPIWIADRKGDWNSLLLYVCNLLPDQISHANSNMNLAFSNPQLNKGTVRSLGDWIGCGCVCSHGGGGGGGGGGGCCLMADDRLKV